MLTLLGLPTIQKYVIGGKLIADSRDLVWQKRASQQAPEPRKPPVWQYAAAAKLHEAMLIEQARANAL